MRSTRKTQNTLLVLATLFFMWSFVKNSIKVLCNIIKLVFQFVSLIPNFIRFSKRMVKIIVQKLHGV